MPRYIFVTFISPLNAYAAAVALSAMQTNTQSDITEIIISKYKMRNLINYHLLLANCIIKVHPKMGISLRLSLSSSPIQFTIHIDRAACYLLLTTALSFFFVCELDIEDVNVLGWKKKINITNINNRRMARDW